MVTLGPGTLKIGAATAGTGTPPAITPQIDISCQINGARISADKKQDDPKTKLCGTVTPGKVTYDYTLSGNMDTDPDKAAGIFKFSQEHAGQLVDYEFIPNTVGVTGAKGQLMMDPLDFGADEYGAPLDSDFEWSLMGQPTYTYHT
jgi:hypothetical protein